MKKVKKLSELSEGIVLFCGKTPEDSINDMKEFSEKYGIEIKNYYITTYDPRLIIAGFELEKNE